MSELKVFNVTYHNDTHEINVNVIAENKLAASELVDGVVMHISSGENVRSGFKFGKSAWNKRTMPTVYKEPSPDWVDYLKSQNTYEGFED